eukprot:c28624_g2_i1 orf=167-4159(+)
MFRPGQELPNSRSSGPAPGASLSTVGSVGSPSSPLVKGRNFVMPASTAKHPEFPVATACMSSGQALHRTQSAVQSQQPSHFIPPLPGSPPAEVPSPPPAGPLPSSPSPPSSGKGLSQAFAPSDQSIFPPSKMPSDPEIVKNIEVLASFVVKNGPEFELMARAKQAGDPKFAFLFEGESGTEAAVGHEYYNWKKHIIGLQIRQEIENGVGKRPENRTASESSHRVNGIRSKCVGPKELSASPTASDMDMEDDYVTTSPKETSRGQVNPKADSVSAGENRDCQQCATLPIVQNSSEIGSPSNCHFPSEQNLDVSSDIGIDEDSSASECEHDDRANSGNLHENAQDVHVETGPVMEYISPQNSWPSRERQLEDSSDEVEADIEESMADKMGEDISRDLGQGTPCPMEGTREPSSEFISDRDDTTQSGDDGQKAEGNTYSCDNGLSKTNKISRDWDPLLAVNKTNETWPDPVSSRPDTCQLPGAVTVADFGRKKYEGSDESDFDDGKLLSKRKKRSNGRSRSRSWSPAGDSRWRRQSGNHSPHSWERHSRSRSRSPRWKRSSSRTPPRDSNPRWGVSGRSDCNFYDKGRRGAHATGMNVCFNFTKGKCFRGPSCRYLHQEISEGTSDGVGRRFQENQNREWQETSTDYQKSWETRGAISSGVFAIEVNSPKRGLEVDPEFEGGSRLRQINLITQKEKHDVMSHLNVDVIEKPVIAEKNDVEERKVSEVVEMHVKHSSPLFLSQVSEFPLQEPLSTGQLPSLHHASLVISSMTSLSSNAPQPSLSSIQHSVAVSEHVPSGYVTTQLSMPKVHPAPQGNPTFNFQHSLPMYHSVPVGNSIRYQPTTICQTVAIHQPTSIREPTSICQPFPFENLQSVQQGHQSFHAGNPNFNQQATFFGSHLPPRPPPPLAMNHTPTLQPGYGVSLPPPVIAASPVTTKQSSFPITNQTPIFSGNCPFIQPGIVPTPTTVSPPQIPLQHGFIPTSVTSAPPSFPRPFIGGTSNQFTFLNLVKGVGQNGVHTRLPVTVPPVSQIPAQGSMPWMVSGPLGSQAALAQPVPLPRPVQFPTFTYPLPGVSTGLGSAPIHQKPTLINSESGEQYDPLADSIEPESSSDLYPWNKALLLNYDPYSTNFPGVQPIDGVRLLDMSPNVPALTLENVSPGLATDQVEAMDFQGKVMNLQLPLGVFSENPDSKTAVVEEAATTGIGVVENVSPPDDNRVWSPGQPLEGATGTGEVETAQEQVQLDLKKSKENRGLKLLRSAVAEYVKEELRPTWRDGHMSKEEFKAIAKKAVDKVIGTLPSHHIPKSQEKVDQYMALSRTKISKLVQSYVDKFLKA